MLERVGLVAALLLVAFFAFALERSSRPDAELDASPFSAVYLASGDVYFGELSWRPRPVLRKTWLLQRTVDGNNEPQVNLLPFTSIFWGPTDRIELNRDNIVFWTRLRNDSQVVQALRDPEALSQSQSLAPDILNELRGQ